MATIYIISIVWLLPPWNPPTYLKCFPSYIFRLMMGISHPLFWVILFHCKRAFQNVLHKISVPTLGVYRKIQNQNIIFPFLYYVSTYWQVWYSFLKSESILNNNQNANKKIFLNSPFLFSCSNDRHLHGVKSLAHNNILSPFTILVSFTFPFLKLLGVTYLHFTLG